MLSDAASASEARVAFEYELDENTVPRVPTIFALDPGRFFLTVGYQSLDFTLVALGRRLSGPRTPAQLGSLPLSDRQDKSAKGLCVNIVEHPNGWYKKLVLRENRIVARGTDTLHYEADTEGGSSGSPVLNDAWEMVALHHWGEPYLETRTPGGAAIPVTVNEGIRVSRIVEELRALVPTLTAQQQPILVAALALGAMVGQGSTVGQTVSVPVLRSGTELGLQPSEPQLSGPQPPVVAERFPVPPEPAPPEPAPPEPAPLRFVIPLEVTLRVLPTLSASTPPHLAPSSSAASVNLSTATPGGPERVRIDPDYRNRTGYDEAFLPGHLLPLPVPGDPIPGNPGVVAPLLVPGRRAGVLDYEHFSVSLHRDRRVALYTATNIDGESYVRIDRQTGLAAAEAGETWYGDPRVLAQYTTGQAFYSANSSYFDRGHLTRRSDVSWGTVSAAQKANADTFHFTNCSPQHWQFNQSSVYWQGVEQYVLEYGALPLRSRLTVFQGPVLRVSDPLYSDGGAGVQVPLLFWKIVVRVQDGLLKASAFLVSQEQLLTRPRRGVRPTTLADAPQVQQFRVPVARIERETGLSFGPLSDTYAVSSQEAGEQVLITSWADVL
ncbi:DNA/RNA non-specific endonuclease [Deinococcus sp.]|uniref:DNA/RNA non-specific endonuclease n=1 Tax=Deinococcus sp. TaxID=47478 RepID=UPI00286E51D1|nr:DNA/RNA non-specific endonuclease [Deinococcus sp.]